MPRYLSEQTPLAHPPLLGACSALGCGRQRPPGRRAFSPCHIRLFIPLLFFLLSAVPAGSAAAADSYQVGFRTLGQWSADTNLRLDVNIWYPSLRPPRELNYAPWTIAAARNGKPVEGRFPLLRLSHASPGTR